MPLIRIRDAMVANWHIKLTALVLATVLWAVVAAEEPTTQLMTVPLQVTLPEGRSLTRDPPEISTVFAGAARELLKLYATPAVIRTTVPDTAVDSLFFLHLSPADVEIPKTVDARVQELEPRTVVLHLEPFTRRMVPVVPRVTVRPDSGFALFGIGVTPGSVQVVGPAPQLGLVRDVVTVQLELTEVTGPVRRSVPLDTAGLGPVRTTRSEVEIAADVGPVSERVLMGVPVVVRATGAGSWASDPPAVIVTVRGPTARLVRLTRDSVEVAALPAGPGPPERVLLEVVGPDGIATAATPDTVVVQRRPRG